MYGVLSSQMYHYADQLLLTSAPSISGMQKQLISSLVSSHFINQNIEESDNLAKYDTWRQAVVYSSEYEVIRSVAFLIALLLLSIPVCARTPYAVLMMHRRTDLWGPDGMHSIYHRPPHILIHN